MSLTGLLFLMFFAAGCFMALYRHPIYGLATYISVFYLHPPSRWWGATLPDLRWSLTAAAVTLLALILRARGGRRTTPRLMGHGVMIAMLAYLLWIAAQLGWAMEPDMQVVLVSAYAKYIILMAIIYLSIESLKHLEIVLWAHVIGCVFLGWIAISDYVGGRFEGFGGPDINEANAGALQVVTGIVVAGALFLAGAWRTKALIVAVAPLIVNALIVTVSRSGFIAAAVAGVIFNVLTAAPYKRFVKIASVLGIVLFVMLTNPDYWARMATIKVAGEQIEGTDTGAGRKELLIAQWDMFLRHPMGCGHRCTATLSVQYLDDSLLTGYGEDRQRASHNTAMSLLVEQGVPGGAFYAFLVWWTWRSVKRIRPRVSGEAGLGGQAFAAISASLAAIFVGDLFVDYLKFEARIWFLALLMVMLKLVAMGELSGHPKDELQPASTRNVK
jgi:O-antigen ligase